RPRPAVSHCTYPPGAALSFPTRRSSDLIAGLSRRSRAMRTVASGRSCAVTSARPRGRTRRTAIQTLSLQSMKVEDDQDDEGETEDRKSTRLNSSHVSISYAVFCLNKKIQ